MLDSDDSYGNSWPALTEDDLEQIDRICSERERAQNDTQSSIGASHSQAAQDNSNSDTIKHALKGMTKAQSTTEILAFFRYQQPVSPPPEQESPLSRFRARARLSVSDIVSPAWCEVQFDYGLRQFRNRPIEKRPAKFVTKDGKEIVISETTAIKNDRIQKKGHAVHKVLEREVHKEEIVLKVKSIEDVWASRFFEFLIRLETLEHDGICRELPIWGILQGQAIYGVIDELRLLRDDIKSAPNDRTVPTFKIEISDSKTRAHPSLPSHPDTLPSRLQLMLYHRLLRDVLSPSPDNDASFTSFCAQTGLQVHRKFSSVFRDEIAQLVAKNKFSYHFLDATCISDLETPFRETVRIFGFDSPKCISSNLTLTYRLRGSDRKRRKVPSSADASKSDESVEVTGLVKDKLAEQGTSAQNEAAVTIASSLEKFRSPSFQESAQIQRGVKTKAGALDSSESDSESGKGTESSGIIGTKVFKYNTVLLEAHLASVLDWWQGKRPPRGVDIEETGRCRSCEYRSGCEWREQKAQELLGSKTAASHAAF